MCGPCRTFASSGSRRSTRRSPGRRPTRPSTSSSTSPTLRRCSRASATPAPSSSAARPSSATTRRARRTSCRRAASLARPAGSGSRRSSSRSRSSRRRRTGARRAAEVVGPLARVEGLPLHAAAVARVSVRALAAQARSPTASRRTSGRPASTRSPRRHGIAPEAVLKFDQNTPPLPGVPQVPLAESMARLNEYPDGTYRELARGGGVLRRSRAGERRRRRRRGRPDPARSRRRSSAPARAPRSTRRPTRSTGSRRPYTAPTVVGPTTTRLSTGSATRTTRPGRGSSPRRSSSARGAARDDRRRRRGVRRVRRPLVRALGRRAAEPRRAPDALEGVRLRRRYGWATRSRTPRPRRCSPSAARRRRSPGPSAAIAAAALREPRLGDVEATIAERERVRTALVARRLRLRRRRRRTSSSSGPTSRSAERLEAQGIVVRAFPEGIRVTVRRPSENDVLLRALGAEPGRRPVARRRPPHDDRDGAPADARARRHAVARASRRGSASSTTC